LISLVFYTTFGEVTFVPIEELAPPGDDEAVPKTALPLVASFLFFPAFPAPPVSFFSETILLKSAAKLAIESEKRKIMNKLNTGKENYKINSRNFCKHING
jgi:hypothetical protein